MRVSRSIRRVRHGFEDSLHFAAQQSRLVARNVGLISAGITALALGVVVGRELRQRYKFQRRTPYDFYAHAGQINPDIEFGVGT